MQKFIAGLVVVLLAPFVSAREPTVPLSVYGRLPYLEDVALSPDGSRITFVRTRGDERDLFVAPMMGATKVLAGLRVGDAKLREVQWEDNDNLIAIVSSTSPPPFGFTGKTREWFQVMRLNIPKNQIRALHFDVPNERTFNVIIGEVAVREVDGRAMLFAPGLWIGDGAARPGMFAFPPGGNARLIQRAQESSAQWLIDANGKVMSELTYDSDRRTWNLRARHDNSLTTVASGKADIDSPDLLGFSAGGDSVVAAFMENGDPVWRPVSLTTGNIGAPLDDGNALHGVFTDPRNGRIIGGVRNSDDRRYVFFDNELQAHWNAALREFPNEVVHMAAHSADFSRLILEVFGERDGFSYFMFDWYEHKAYSLGPRYEGLTQVGPVRKIAYKAQDGLQIPGFLTTPHGMEAKNLPLVVLPHGGPQASDTEQFDWWAQALADQGYAVLQPNYRGSSLDVRFVEKGYGEWGRKMQTDLSDGVSYLAAQGIIDPKRVCIVGGSYGGYAALAGVTLQSGIYRCAVSVAGVSDLVRMRNWTRHNEQSVATRYWDRFWGVADNDDEGLRKVSPIDHLASVSVPLLLIHGKDDTVVPYEQSDYLLSAMKKAGKPVEMVTMKHEDHWLSRSDTREQMLEATVAFLRTNNPPD